MATMQFAQLVSFAILCVVRIPYGVNCETISTEDARLDKIEALLKSVVRKSQELEVKMEHMETELEAQKVLNSELTRRIENLENELQKTDHDADSDSEENSSGEHINRQSSAAFNGTLASRMAKTKDSQISSKVQSKVQVPRQAETVKNRLKRQIQDATVAFTAVISRTDLRNLGAGHSIVFDKIITNVGGGYHNTTGVFTAPASGIYVFNMALFVNAGNREYLCFVRNGIPVLYNYGQATGSQDSISTSRTVVLELSKGNEVWVRTSSASYHGTGQIHGNGFTTFSGWLIAYTE